MERQAWFLLYALVIAASFAFTINIPLFGDEGLYSIAIKDVQKYGIMPYATYFGEPMFWKPPLMFAAYGILTKPFVGLVPEEVLFRLPSLFLVIISTAMLYSIFKDDVGEKNARIAILLFLLSTQVFSYGMRVLTDILTFAFVIAALYTIKKYAERSNLKHLILFALLIFGAGMSKSHLMAIFAFFLPAAYYFAKKGALDKKIVLCGAIAGMLLLLYPLLLGNWSQYYYSLYTQDTARLSIEKILRNSYSFSVQGGLLGMIALILSALHIIRDKKIGFYDIWGWSSLVTLFSAASYLPWYLLYFAPAFAIIIGREIKNNPIDRFVLAVFVIAVIFISLYFTFNVGLSLFKDENELSGILNKYENRYIMVVMRLGESIANKIYNFPYAVMATPQNAFHGFKNGTMQFYGIKEAVIEPNNIECLVHNYENETCLPRLIYQFNKSERYLPPVGRTAKNWKGGFDIIVAEKDYAEVIKKVAPEYEEVLRTKNGEFYVFEK